MSAMSALYHFVIQRHPRSEVDISRPMEVLPGEVKLQIHIRIPPFSLFMKSEPRNKKFCVRRWEENSHFHPMLKYMKRIHPIQAQFHSMVLVAAARSIVFIYAENEADFACQRWPYALVSLCVSRVGQGNRQRRH
jgi:hypothetical protein